MQNSQQYSGKYNIFSVQDKSISFQMIKDSLQKYWNRLKITDKEFIICKWGSHVTCVTFKLTPPTKFYIQGHLYKDLNVLLHTFLSTQAIDTYTWKNLWVNNDFVNGYQGYNKFSRFKWDRLLQTEWIH